MRTIQPGHEILSLFDFSSKTEALTKTTPQRRLALSMVSAFLIVIIVGLFLSIVQRALSSGPQAQAASVVADNAEPVAFQPGQYIKPQVSEGYIGR